jgi:alginate O-acetyltransferase complex protein AlgI
VTFFPHLVAGPIQRAQSLAVQVMLPRFVTEAGVREGLGLIGWGLFKKMVIADSMAPICDKIFNGTPHPSALEVLIGVYAFAMQIYGDFAGYSDIARGLGKMMGFDIMINFKNPYFVTNPRDFWRNWHISLSEWLRDNLYIPLGGSRKGPAREYGNIMITMMLGGLWHGANWTFVLWGFFHGIVLILEHVLRSFFQRVDQSAAPIAPLWRGVQIFCMFHLTCLGWLFFRARSIGQIQELLKGLTRWGAGLPSTEAGKMLFFVWIFVLAWGLRKMTGYLKPGLIRDMSGAMTAALLVYFIFFHGISSKPFIYFQF